MKRFGIAALAISLAAGSTGAASAQGVMADPATIAHCLCGEHAVAFLKDRVTQAQQVYDQDKAAVEGLDQQIAQARASVNVSIEGQVDATRALNNQREQLYTRTYNVDLPALQGAIRAYDNAAGPYATHCASQNFDAATMAQIQASLSCPPLPPMRSD
jgi:TolA-binding protein